MIFEIIYFQLIMSQFSSNISLELSVFVVWAQGSWRVIYVYAWPEDTLFFCWLDFSLDVSIQWFPPRLSNVIWCDPRSRVSHNNPLLFTSPAELNFPGWASAVLILQDSSNPLICDMHGHKILALRHNSHHLVSSAPEEELERDSIERCCCCPVWWAFSC